MFVSSEWQIGEAARRLFCLTRSYGEVTLEVIIVLPSDSYWHKCFVVGVRLRLLCIGECLLTQNILGKQKESSDRRTNGKC